MQAQGPDYRRAHGSCRRHAPLDAARAQPGQRGLVACPQQGAAVACEVRGLAPRYLTRTHGDTTRTAVPSGVLADTSTNTRPEVRSAPERFVPSQTTLL